MPPSSSKNQPQGFSLFPAQQSQPFSTGTRPSTDLPAIAQALTADELLPASTSTSIDPSAPQNPHTLPTPAAINPLGIQPSAAIPPATHPFTSASSTYSHDDDHVYTSSEPLPNLSEALARTLTTAEMPLPPPPLATTFSPSSAAARSSIAKLPPRDDDHASADAPAIRSIFPIYNPEVPLAQQDYFPTQTSPTRIPRGVISRPLYEPGPNDIPDSPGHSTGEPTPAAQMPLAIDNDILAGPYGAPSAGNTNAPWPPAPRRPSGSRPTLPKPSSTESIKSLWKVANGWKASATEGCVFTLSLTQEPDLPIYTLSSSVQPFYQLKLDPTSTSAHVTLARLDPAKALKTSSHTSLLPRRADNSSTTSTTATSPDANTPGSGKNWQTAISTVLEEEARLHRPHDGLVALLYPSAARQMALDKSHDAAAVQMSENEAARLIWDDDTESHYLVHPALAAPFRVAIERTPAWSRTEYTLEHHESPAHLAKLTRDGTGAGTLQVDTALAAKIESFFIVDVAVSALLLVAHRDSKNAPVMAEAFFEPPPGETGAGIPMAPPPAKLRTALRSVESLDSAGSGGRQGKEGLVGSLKRMAEKKKKKKEMAMRKNGSVQQMGKSEYDMDLESADSSYITKQKQGSVADDLDAFAEKLPWPLRIIVWFFTAIFKCFFWVLVVLFKMLMLMGKGLARCVGVE